MMLLFKVTFLLGGTFLLVALLTRRSAALRHLVWTLALAGAPALAILTPVVPGFTVEMPIARALTHAPMPATRALRSLSQPAVQEPFPAADRVSRASVASRGPGIRAMLVLAYLLGGALVAAWYAIGRFALARLARQSTAPQSAEWTSLLARAAQTAGVHRPVQLLLSERVGSPMTWGIRRPRILLPAQAADWPADRRRMVLAHELAHTARGDQLAQLVAALAAIVYWFHPLVWLASRRLRAEAERAADDQVLAQGIPGEAYAGELLAIARTSRALNHLGLVAIGMARPSHLEGRLLAILDGGRERRGLGHRPRRYALAGALLAVLPLAAMRPTFRPTAAEPRERARQPQAAASASGDSTFERSVAAHAGEWLDLDLETGADVHIRGWDEPKVKVVGRLSGRDWRDTRLEVSRADGGVRLRSWSAEDHRSFSVSLDLEIMVPRHFDVHLGSAGGDLVLSDIEGTFRGHTGGGELRIERAHGEARLSTGGGDIHVSESELRGSVNTGGGLVLLSRVRGGLKGTSGSGPVVYSSSGRDETGDLSNLRVSDNRDRVSPEPSTRGQTGVLHLDKAGGGIELDEAPDGARVSTGGGNIRIGRSGGDVKANTGGGDIAIGPVEGSVHATTGAGTVRLSVVHAEVEEQTVEVETGTGDVTIELPHDFDGTLDLETAFTRTFRRQTRIVSDWQAPVEVSDEWDDSQGSPRRYVRANTAVGSGRAIVRVRAVNGDITIRRHQ